MKVMNKRLIDWYEAKEVLSKLEGELVHEQKNVIEFFNIFCKLKKKEVEELKKELENLNILNEKAIINIVNMLPEIKKELEAILAYERVVVSEEDKDKILSIVKKFV